MSPADIFTPPVPLPFHSYNPAHREARWRRQQPPPQPPSNVRPRTFSSLTPDDLGEKDVEGAGGLSDASKDSVHSDASTDKLERDWTDAEERKVVRKLDLVVLLLLFFGFVSFQLERNNIANAVSSTLFKDVGITQNQYNTGQGLLYLGIIVFECVSLLSR